MISTTPPRSGGDVALALGRLLGCRHRRTLARAFEERLGELASEATRIAVLGEPPKDAGFVDRLGLGRLQVRGDHRSRDQVAQRHDLGRHGEASAARQGRAATQDRADVEGTDGHGRGG